MAADFPHKNSQTQKTKETLKFFNIVQFVEVFELIILVKKSFYFHQEMTMAGSKYWKKSSTKSYFTSFSILTLAPSFVDVSVNIFLPKWSAKKAVQNMIHENIFWDLCVFCGGVPMELPRPISPGRKRPYTNHLRWKTIGVYDDRLQ